MGRQAQVFYPRSDTACFAYGQMIEWRISCTKILSAPGRLAPAIKSHETEALSESQQTLLESRTR